jgi:hypothetical protein
MRSFAFVPLALTCALSAAAAAQTGQESNLVLTVFAGTVTGHSLWAVGKQPLCVLDSLNQCTSQYDTLGLSRSVGSSLVLGATATYFISPHVGLHLEMSYLGLPVESSCTALFLHPDPTGPGATEQRRNGQICDDIQSQSAQSGSIAIFGGVTVRAASRRTFSPYVRGNLGIVNQPHSSIDVNGAFVAGNGALFQRQVVADQNPRNTTLLLGAAAGFTSPLGTGYQFRFEVRDVVTSMERLLGPANGLGIGPTATRTYHHVALTLGIDVVLERKRGRRY